eukprot:s363_g3.t1
MVWSYALALLFASASTGLADVEISGMSNQDGQDGFVEDDECQNGQNADGSSGCALHALQLRRNASNDTSETLEASLGWVKTLYHQTTPSAGKSILKEGFRLGHVGWCGAGIYFATSVEATSGKIKGPDSGAGYIIEAKVNLGRIKQMPWHCTTSPSCNHHPYAKCQDRKARGSWLKAQGYDSINFTPDPYGPEYVIYNPDRDKTGDGQLDKEEFWHFIQSIGGIPPEASGDLHEFIDSDNSGQISFDEFLNWVHPDRELELLEKSHADWKSDLVRLSNYQRPEKPLMETRPGKPVVIELWIGPDYKFMADRMKLMLCQMFSPEQVHWEFKMDGRISGTCSLVLAKVGRGIELWNRDTMMAYREDPFLDSSGSTARKWLTDVLQKCLPDVERASNLHRLKQRRHMAHMHRQGPSPVARDLVRHLLSPKRQVRFDAKQALQHKWLTAPSEVSAVEEALDAPLLQWSDFEEGLTGIQREFQRAAEEVVQAVEGIQIGSDLEQQILLDPKDDRLRNCVVCFQESGHFGFFCKQCYHSVCVHCLVKLQKPECPHCRKPATDVAAAQHLAKIAEAFDAQAAMRAGSAAWEVALKVGSNVAENLDKVGVDAVVDIDMSYVRPLSEEQRKRGNACCVCRTPAGAMNHVCPACYASICFPCAKSLKECCCPSCGDVQRNAEPLKHYLAAGEAWDAAMGLREGVLSALTTGAESLTTRGGALMTSFDNSPSSDRKSEYDQALRRAISVQAQLQVSHACHLCSAPSSAFDMACSKCTVSVCSSCIGTRLGPDPCCPGCGDKDVFNESAVRFQRNAQQISNSAAELLDGLWLLGQGLFSESTGGSQQIEQAALPSEETPLLTASAHVFINGRWSSRIVSFTLEVDKSPSAEDAVLLVKSTQWSSHALTDPIFDKDTYIQLYEPGIDILDLREWTKKRKGEDRISPAEDQNTLIPGLQLQSLSSTQLLQDTNSITEADKSPVLDLNYSSEDGERKSSSETPQVEETAGKAKAKPKTTVMLRNLPNNYTRSMLLHLLDEQGFGGNLDSLRSISNL